MMIYIVFRPSDSFLFYALLPLICTYANISFYKLQANAASSPAPSLPRSPPRAAEQHACRSPHRAAASPSLSRSCCRFLMRSTPPPLHCHPHPRSSTNGLQRDGGGGRRPHPLVTRLQGRSRHRPRHWRVELHRLHPRSPAHRRLQVCTRGVCVNVNGQQFVLSFGSSIGSGE